MSATSRAGREEITFYGTVRRACDYCRRRKIRCNGCKPCRECKTGSFECTYWHVSKKKGPRTARSVRKANESLDARTPESGTDSLASDTCTLSPQSSCCYPVEDFDANLVGCDETPFALDYQILNSASEKPVPLVSASHERRDGTQDVVCKSLATSVFLVDEQLLPCDFIQAPTTGFQSTFFFPYAELFFAHLFPIMPVLDPKVYLDSDLLRRPGLLSSSNYTLLTAMAAAVIVQLNLSIPCEENSTTPLAELLIKSCLEERTRSNYLDNPDTSTVITSFFLFAYFGNMERQKKAWYYLHEAITFAELIGLDDEESTLDLNAAEVQWRRRLFWLLFITERAYALQRRNRVRMRHFSVMLPTIFESEDPRLLYGFVNLVNLYRTVDIEFVSTWSGQLERSTCSKFRLLELQSKFDTSIPLLTESIETQQLDIMVSRQWLHTLVWQTGVRHGLLLTQEENPAMHLHYPVLLAGELVRIISTANRQSLDSHGIGMEQKIADIAYCLADVLRCSSGDDWKHFHQGRDYLSALFRQLANIRGQPSRYLQPLLLKAEPIISSAAVPPSLHLDQDYPIQQLSDETDSEDILSILC